MIKVSTGREEMCYVMNAEVISQWVMVQLYEDSNLVSGSRSEVGIVDFTVASVHLHLLLCLCVLIAWNGCLS